MVQKDRSVVSSAVFLVARAANRSWSRRPNANSKVLVSQFPQEQFPHKAVPFCAHTIGATGRAQEAAQI